MTEPQQLHVAFVTGGSGFIGQQFITYLTQRGVKVRALARSESAMGSVRQAGAEPVQGDLDDEQALVASMTGCDVVFHWRRKGMAGHDILSVDSTNAHMVKCRHKQVSLRDSSS